MFLLKFVALLYIFTISTADTYEIPKAEIQVFEPKGFRIRISDSPGISQVHFHVNISKASNNVSRKFSKLVERPRNGKWTFAKRRTGLHVGDNIFYKVFVIKDGFGYIYYGQNCEIGGTQIRGHRGHQRDVVETCKREPLPSSVTDSEDDTDYNLNNCNQIVLNSTLTLISLQSDVNELIKKNNRLISFLEQHPDSRKLSLSGQIPPDNRASKTVKFVLKEKLNLEPSITYAERHSNGNITFEVKTIEDKLLILEESKEKLKYSKIIIS